MVIYKYRSPLAAILKTGAIGAGAWILAGGTIAGYNLYKKYQAAGIAKDSATIEAEAAAGATDVSATGVAVDATGAEVGIGAESAIGDAAIAGAGEAEILPGIGGELLTWLETVAPALI